MILLDITFLFWFISFREQREKKLCSYDLFNALKEKGILGNVFNLISFLAFDSKNCFKHLNWKYQFHASKRQNGKEIQFLSHVESNKCGLKNQDGRSRKITYCNKFLFRGGHVK